MRIWIVNHYALPPGSSGGPTRHLGLSRKLRDRGHDVVIIASLFDHYSRQDHRSRGGTRIVEAIDGVTYIWVATPPYGPTWKRALNMAWFTAGVGASPRRIRLPDPDVVIGSSPHLLAPVAAARLARARGAAFVVEVRDVWPQSLVDLGSMGAGNPLIRGLACIEGWLYRRADAVVIVPPLAGDHVMSYGVDPARIHVIGNGVDAGFSSPILGRTGSGLVVTYAGTMGLANGLEVVIDAARSLEHRQRDDIRIRMIGGGPERAGLEQRARGLTNIVFEGPIPANDVPAALAQSDAGLLVLQDSPVFRWGLSPTKLFDYMAAGLPVITSVSAPSDVVSDIGAGIAARPGDPESLADAMEELADRPPEVRAEMGQRGRQRVLEEHTFDVMADRIEALAESLRAVQR